MISLAYAEPAAGAASSPQSSLMSFVPLLLIFVIFYFLLIRPQQKKMKQHKQMLGNIKVGDKVVLASGFFGVVTTVGDINLEVKIADNVKVKVQKSAVSEISNSSTVSVEPEVVSEK